MKTKAHSASHNTIVVFDFGSQYSHLIVRRLRDIGVYCELESCTRSLSDLEYLPVGIILSGSPYSVYEDGSPHADPAIWESSIPILGICYGLQEMAVKYGGVVSSCIKREYGRASITVLSSPSSKLAFLGSELLLLDVMGSDEKSSLFWMSHGDQISKMPEDFVILATSETSPFAAIAHKSKKILGVQFHPEVTHSKEGERVLSNFAIKICKAEPTWNMKSLVEHEINKIREIVGPTALVVGAVSGGVDSTVAAKLMQIAIGSRFHGILVDNGLLRKDEADKVFVRLNRELGINLTVVDASTIFLEALKGVSEPEKKRRIIGHKFIDVFQAKSEEINNKNMKENSNAKVEFLLQGTLYPDVIESSSFKGKSVTIKTHHNVGGLKENMPFKVIEPLRELFKDEVRVLGQLLGLSHDLVWRHPFPGPGLAIRIIGEVTKEKVNIVQQADEIFIYEIRKAGLYNKISQAYAALLPFDSVGVMGDQRTYEKTICLRAVESTDFMTADWFNFPHEILKIISSRIINEVHGINRVMYDISSKPPATIELE